MPAKKEKEQPINGILVQIEDERTTIQPLGSVKITEVPTLLKLAAIRAEQQLGVGG